MNRPVPWKSHLPALALVGLLAALIAFGGPWPEPVADGFDGQGRPIHWQWAPAAIGAAVTIWFVAFVFDAVWPAVERNGRKRFNPLSLVDELFVGWQLVGVARGGVAHGLPPAIEVGAWTAGALAVAAAVWLELRRQVEADPLSLRAALSASAVVDELAALPPTGRWSYWSVQKPPHRVLFGALGLAFVAGALFIPDVPVPLRVLLVVPGGVVLAVCSGGLRTVVTPRQLVLRAGRFGPPLLRLPSREIADVVIPEFDPLRDFGGWGIRRGFFGDFAGVWAFNIADAGVLVRTHGGKRYLIGTDEPERLAAALNAARASA